MNKAEDITNFPRSGDNQKISLANSAFSQFPYAYAADVKENHAEIWLKGGNEFGNQAFVLWGKARSGDESESVLNWIKRRERFMNRHQNDFQLAGVVAVMKWGGVVNKGLAHMKQVIGEAKDKVEKAADWQAEFAIQKADGDRNLVFGWANVAIRKDGEQILDAHADMIDPNDLEDAAYLFNLEFRETGEMHKGDAVGRLVESFVVTPEKLQKMGLAADALPLGWWVGFYIEDDDAFAKVKAGEYQMFSIQGRAVREEVRADGG